LIEVQPIKHAAMQLVSRETDSNSRKLFSDYLLTMKEWDNVMNKPV